MRCGFTLIELLVVISIIALLVAILLPALNKARYQAKFTVCASHQHSIGVGVLAYMTEYNGKLPPHVSQRTRSNGTAFWSYANMMIQKRAAGQLPADAESYGIVFRGILPSYEIWNCPLAPYQLDNVVEIDGQTYSFKELYESDLKFVGDGSLYMPMTYLVFWNYGGFGDPYLTSNEPEFIGPSKYSDKVGLILTDAAFYQNNNHFWRAGHSFEDSSKGEMFHEKFNATDDPVAELGDMKCNALYKDGHVEAYHAAQESIGQYDGRGNTFYIPREWK